MAEHGGECEGNGEGGSEVEEGGVGDAGASQVLVAHQRADDPYMRLHPHIRMHLRMCVPCLFAAPWQRR